MIERDWDAPSWRRYHGDPPEQFLDIFGEQERVYGPWDDMESLIYSDVSDYDVDDDEIDGDGFDDEEDSATGSGCRHESRDWFGH